MPAPFEALLNRPQDMAHVAITFRRAIANSFARDGGRQTQDEIRRRFGFCEKWFRLLRGDKGWGLARTLDAIPLALRKELDGTAWEPDNRQMWTPADGPI